MSTPLRLSVAVAALGTLSGWSDIARAGDATLAESLFREGQALMAAHDYAQACPKLEESYRQDPGTGGVLLALALCYESDGRPASAWSTFDDAAARLHASGRADKEADARQRARALEPRLSTLVIRVSDGVAALPGLVIKRDDQPIPRAAWGSAVPVDPGRHVIEAIATGRRSWQRVISLADNADRQTLEVPMLELAPVAPAPAPPLPPTAAKSPAPAPKTAPAPSRTSPSSWTPLRIAGVATGAAGVVALGVGTAFGIKAKSSNDESNKNGHCDSTGCDPAGLESRNDAFGAAGVSTAFFVAGAVLVAGGITLYFVGGPKSESQVARVRLLPAVATNGGGLFVHGGF